MNPVTMPQTMPLLATLNILIDYLIIDGPSIQSFKSAGKDLKINIQNVIITKSMV